MVPGKKYAHGQMDKSLSVRTFFDRCADIMTQIEDFTDVHYYPSDAANQALFRTLQEQITCRLRYSGDNYSVAKPLPINAFSNFMVFANRLSGLTDAGG